ncbi:MAG: ATP-binding protein [Candidatus Eisenbacteria bacterium]|nr:ATP-binding protein [Candidatus Eisenbacteria bacterium]
MAGERRGTLRFQLQVAFLLLSLLPAVILTLILLQSLPWALDRWASPAVRQTFENALSITNDTLTRIQNDLRQRWSLSIEVAKPALWGELKQHAPEIGERLNVDFMVLYPASPDSLWTPVRILTRDPLVEAPVGLVQWGKGNLESGLFLRGSRGELAFAQRMPRPKGPPGPVLAVGIYLDPALYERLADLNSAVSRHEQLRADANLNKAAVQIGAMLLLLVLGVTSVWVAGRLSENLSSPVEELALAMDRVAQGDLETRVTPSGTREIRSLVSAFNQMTAELTETRDRLARAERAQAWRDAALRVAHEIRNPLQPITLALHRIDRLLAHDPALRAEVQPAVRSILDEVEALKRLAANFAELARMPEPDPEITNLATFVAGSAPLLEFPGVVLAIEVAVPSPAALVDRGLLREVLTNLVKNAAEAMPEGGRVILRVAANRAGGHDWATIEIEDTGPGVPPAERVRIFEPHVTSKAEGSGLGLAIVERIVGAHHGRVEVVDGASGGALFRVWLPTVASPESLS